MVTLTGSLDDLERVTTADRPRVAIAESRANLSPELIAACDVILAPPLSGESDLVADAADLTQRILAGELRPTMATVRLPMAVGETGPFDAIEAFMADQRLMPLVLANGIVLGGQGAVKEWGVTVVVVTDYDIAFARNLADDLAMAVWERRAEFDAGHDMAGRPTPLWPFEPAEWVGESFAE